MKTIQIIPDGNLAEWLLKAGIHWPTEGYEIDEGELSRILAHADSQHPAYSTKKKRDWALYQIIAKNRISGHSKLDLGTAAAGDLQHFAMMAEAQNRGFVAMRLKIEEHLENINRGFSGVVSEIKNCHTGIASQIFELREELAKRSEEERNQNTVKAIETERSEVEEMIAAQVERERVGKARKNEQILLWLWRLALIGLLTSMVWGG